MVIDFKATPTETLNKELNALKDARVSARTAFELAQIEVKRRQDELDQISVQLYAIRNEIARRSGARHQDQ